MTAVAIAAAVLLHAGVASAWEDHVIHQDHLAVDRALVDLGPFIAQGDGPVRVELRGTITSHVDGSTFDALSRWNGARRLTSDDPWILVPDGARIVEEDPEAHRYVLEIPRDGRARFELLVRRLAHEHFLTPSELTARTTGAIEVRLLDRVPLAAPVQIARADATSGVPLAYLAGGTGAPLLLVVAMGVARRRRRRGDRVLLARAKKAVRAVCREADRLGPAFDEVATASRRMLDGAIAVVHHLDEVRAALRRTRALRSRGAHERRADLHRAAREALDRLAQIVDRLEATATQLAAQTASHAASHDVEALLAALDAEITTAVSADDEARAA